MRRNRGFTLIEFLAAVAVATVLCAAGIPAVQRIIESSQTSATLSLLSASIAEARIEAVSRNRTVSVCPSANGTTCRSDLRWDDGWLVFVDDRGSDPKAGAILQHVQRARGQVAVSATTGRPRIRFLPDGRSSGSNVTLRLCARKSANALAQLVVNNAGRMRVERERAVAPCSFAPVQ